MHVCLIASSPFPLYRKGVTPYILNRCLCDKEPRNLAIGVFAVSSHVFKCLFATGRSNIVGTIVQFTPQPVVQMAIAFEYDVFFLLTLILPAFSSLPLLFRVFPSAHRADRVILGQVAALTWPLRRWRALTR